jgi:hypothetical protein
MHVQLLFEQPKLSVESADALRALLDTTLKHIRALGPLEQPVDTWDTLLIFLLTSKLDTVTYRAWEYELFPNDLVTFKKLVEFLQHKCQMLDAVGNSKGENWRATQNKVDGKPNQLRQRPMRCLLTRKQECSLCKGKHKLFQCSQFLQLNTQDQLNAVKRLNLCFNCLGDHLVKSCRASNCKNCGKRRNTLIHISSQTEKEIDNIDNA